MCHQLEVFPVLSFATFCSTNGLLSHSSIITAQLCLFVFVFVFVFVLAIIFLPLSLSLSPCLSFVPQMSKPTPNALNTQLALLVFVFVFRSKNKRLPTPKNMMFVCLVARLEFSHQHLDKHLKGHYISHESWDKLIYGSEIFGMLFCHNSVVLLFAR